MDPTFTHHFGMAAQSDILWQAARDRERRQARPAGRTVSSVLLRAGARLLELALWPYTARRGQRESGARA